MNLQEQFKHQAHEFANTGDGAGLSALIANHPELCTTQAGEYPNFHRILDIWVGGRFFRVCRQISHGEALVAVPIDEPSDVPGVPLWLTGEKLREWAVDEEENPSDEPTDWNKYR
jgi:hypothetical protein